MKLDISEKSLPVYEALASGVRLQMIRLLAVKPMNVKELAGALGLSSAIMTMHIKKLERAELIKTEMFPGKGGAQKVCSLNVESLQIEFPQGDHVQQSYYETEIGVGHYTDFEIQPTCGLATKEKLIGEYDDPRFFLSPERFDARILWFGQGYIEYKVPNYMLGNEVPTKLEVSLELGSEAPASNNDWPSDIHFALNGVPLGAWTSPGDFGGRKGKYTPEWWNIDCNQYGLLKVLRIDGEGTFIDGYKVSDVTLHQLDIRRKQWALRLSVPEDAANVGGLTIYGEGFGNYDQNILFRLFYEKVRE
ncbi:MULTISPECIES: ArsR/SmtB family transcription factor [Paenibacillus]|uniref:ArsR/SmtB family transcription factor n=1 Tax=Paenibacillus TaxID=44249 RepID=UPI0022B873FD|nr:helix-turn-helix domain-containing protein [Paenibacillus caseinilyticus]MCZ8519366.1 helix-turn-helix domain-containing protein [Paenibacillus caseinilyticus]